MGGEPAEILVPDGRGEDVLEVVDDHHRIELHQPGEQHEGPHGAERGLRADLEPYVDLGGDHRLNLSLVRCS